MPKDKLVALVKSQKLGVCTSPQAVRCFAGGTAECMTKGGVEFDACATSVGAKAPDSFADFDAAKAFTKELGACFKDRVKAVAAQMEKPPGCSLE
jgi:hypothetical protein